MKTCWTVISKYLFVVTLGLACVACEGPFSGNRPFELSEVNGPHQLKFISFQGTTYLAFINTNYRFQRSAGSLHFYSLGDPSQPTLVENLSVPLPSQVSDFVIDANGRLIIADRSENRLIFFERSGDSWVQQTIENGDDRELKVSDNPQRLEIFQSKTTGKDTLMVVSQSTGTPHFVDLETLQFAALPAGAEDSILFNDMRGADLYMEPRQEEVANEDDPILGGGERNGYGIYSYVFLPDTTQHQVIVFASALAMGLFGFRYDSFSNSSNFTWNMERRREGYDEAGVDYPGTKDSGFRGLAVDQNGTVYASSRDDNAIYALGASHFMRDKVNDANGPVRGRNTRGFQENSTGGFLLKEFDETRTDESFPRLGELVVDCAPSVGPFDAIDCDRDDGAAGRAWVLGLETKKVYRLAAAAGEALSSSATILASTEFDESPQGILWHPTANRLYVSVPKSSKVHVLEADSLEVLSQF